MLSKIFLVLKTIFEAVLLVLIAITALVVILSGKGIKGYRAFVLQSGSMSPTMTAGSLILTQTVPPYQKNEVITFYTNNSDGSRENLPTTHRIVGIKTGANLGYQTKGDANNTPDPFITPASSVIGKVVLHLPYFGNFSDFAHTRNGLIFLVIIPITILAYQQLVNIKDEIIKLLAKRKK